MIFQDIIKKLSNLKLNKTNILLSLFIILVLIGLSFVIYWAVGKSGNIPWHNCIIPYEIDSSFSKNDINIIMDSMNIITLESGGIIFRQKNNSDIEYVFFKKSDNPNDCGDSSIAKQLGGNTILLSSMCISKRVILHELLHTLGFEHEQSRKDRDLYITVNYDNIIDKNKYNFDIKTNVIYDAIIKNTNYDYNSIMHYPIDAFTKNKLPTITIKDKTINTRYIGLLDYLSNIDKIRLKKYYELYK